MKREPLLPHDERLMLAGIIIGLVGAVMFWLAIRFIGDLF